MSFQKINDEDLKNKVYSLWSSFHNGRIDIVKNFNLHDLLKRKNHFLLDSIYGSSFESLIQGMLMASMSSSDETRAGSFNHELMTWLLETSGRGRRKDPSSKRMDFIGTEGEAGEMKSGEHYGNAASRQQTEEDLLEANPVAQIMLYAYGNGVTRKGSMVEYGGAAAWEYCSGDPDTYLKIQEFTSSFRKENTDLLEEYETFLAAKKESLLEKMRLNFSHPDSSINFVGVANFVSSLVRPKETLPPFIIENDAIDTAIKAAYDRHISDIYPKPALINRVLTELNISHEHYGKAQKLVGDFIANHPDLESKKGKGGGIRRKW